MSERTTPGPQDYSRPQQLWQCGRAGDCGGGCLPPTAWGRCRQGTPCRPRLSMRGRRGVFIMSCVFGTLGLLLLGLYRPWRLAVIEPGQLAQPHSQALSQVSNEQRCASCHEAAGSDPLVWMLIAAGHSASVTEGQATRCLKCHDQTLDSAAARFAHNLAPESLRSTTLRIAGQETTAADLLRVKFSARGEVACSTCHREHHGLHANLTQLSDQQCQACHVKEFESFAHGHPEFQRTLPPRRSRIAFDHVSHAQTHFPEKQQSWTCGQCHVPDARRDVQRLAGFDQSCGQCHAQPIRAATLDGLAAFSFPTLDVARLAASGNDIGAWPRSAQGDFDGSLPPLVRLLLMADPAAATALEKLGDKFDFTQVQSTDDLHHVAALAWAYKRLLNELANDPPGALERRFSKTAQGRLPHAQLETVSRQLPPALFREARRLWLPELGDELAARPAVGAAAMLMPTTVFPQVRENAPVGELLIENPLGKLKPGSESSVPAVPGSTIFTPPELPTPDPEPIAEKSSPVTPPALQGSSNTGELLAANPLRGTGGSVTATKPEPISPPPQPSPNPTKSKPEIRANSPLDPNEFATGGTWYLDDATLSVRYRTRGHADELMRLLLDVAAASTHPQIPRHGPLPALLSDSSLKNCASCHSIDTAEERYEINWATQYRNTARRRFTEFSHRPHLVQPGLEGCTDCHRMNTTSNVLNNYREPDPLAHAHDFKAITKSQCATCHTTSESGGRCTLCHSYHVNAVRSHE